MYFLPFTDLVTRLSNSNMAPPSRFATVSEFLLGLRDSASTGSSAIDISSIQNIYECIRGKNKTKKTHEGQSRWCKSSIQAMSNETPQRLFSATHSRYGRRWTNCTRISNTTVHCGWIRVVESIQYMRFREKERWRCVPLYQQGMEHRLHSL